MIQDADIREKLENVYDLTEKEIESFNAKKPRGWTESKSIVLGYNISLSTRTPPLSPI